MDVEVIIKRGLVYAAALAAIAAIYAVLLRIAGAVFLARRGRAQPDHRPARDVCRRAAVAPGEERHPDRPRSRLLPRSLRLPPRAGRVRARSEQRSRSAAPQRAARASRHRDAGRRSHGADARAGVGRRRRLRHDRARAASRMPPPLVAEPLGSRPRGCSPDTRSRSTTRWRSGAWMPREVEFWREAGIHYFVPCVSKEGTIAVMALGRKAERASR